MKEPIYITEEELEYYTKPYKTLNEGNEGNVGILTREEYERDSQNCISLEEFGRLWKESIRKIIPNP